MADGRVASRVESFDGNVHDGFGMDCGSHARKILRRFFRGLPAARRGDEYRARAAESFNLIAQAREHPDAKDHAAGKLVVGEFQHF